MPYYEIITEPGSSMVANYENDEEAIGAVKAHHARAVNGDVGGPTGHPAERIVKVLKYEVHPGDYGSAGVIPVDQLSAIATQHTKDGLLNVDTFSAALRNQVSPLRNDDNANRHDSRFVMPETESLDPALWQSVEAA
jgi:hypothetical protein